MPTSVLVLLVRLVAAGVPRAGNSTVSGTCPQSNITACLCSLAAESVRLTGKILLRNSPYPTKCSPNSSNCNSEIEKINWCGDHYVRLIFSVGFLRYILPLFVARHLLKGCCHMQCQQFHLVPCNCSRPNRPRTLINHFSIA